MSGFQRQQTNLVTIVEEGAKFLSQGGPHTQRGHRNIADSVQEQTKWLCNAAHIMQCPACVTHSMILFSSRCDYIFGVLGTLQLAVKPAHYLGRLRCNALSPCHNSSG